MRRLHPTRRLGKTPWIRATDESALHAGVHCYLREPLQPNELLARIRSALTDHA
jgi:CheY-like chemotaxis protein